MKIEVDSKQKLQLWLSNQVPAIFQGLNLIDAADILDNADLTNCVFLGCEMKESTRLQAATFTCLVVPRIPGLPFDAFTPGLYSPFELFQHFDSHNPEASYEKCLDRVIYRSYFDIDKKEVKPVDADVLIARRIHDASISDALDDLLTLDRRRRSVAIMGGHDFPRDEKLFFEIARLCMELTSEGYFIVTGGGPGLMEAANLGAYCAGFNDPLLALDSIIEKIKTAPKYDDKRWFMTAYQAWKDLGAPHNSELSRSLGIPTWFYGHEPPNIFSTDIAKYFENSVREEGLLAIALAGVIFAQGNAGTVQEIFQDACQNYYATYEKTKSPMILLGVDYWAPDISSLRAHVGDKRKPVYEAVEKLAIERGFVDRLLLTDSFEEVKNLIRKITPLKK